MVYKMFGMLMCVLLYRYLGGWGNLGEFEEHFLPVLGILKSPQKSLDAHEPREMLDGGFNE